MAWDGMYGAIYHHARMAGLLGLGDLTCHGAIAPCFCCDCEGVCCGATGTNADDLRGLSTQEGAADWGCPTFPTGGRRLSYLGQYRILRRAVDAAVKRCEPNGERIKIDLPFELRERWERQYGQGKGQIEYRSDDETLSYINECEANEKFSRCIESVRAIARNVTYRHVDKAMIQISKYYTGREFSWCVYSPSGKFVMNGGIINHSAEGQDWSVHT